jgi:hypothetical protein
VITDPKYYARFKRSSLAKDDLSLEEKFTIVDALYNEARLLGHFDSRDILSGIEDVIRLAEKMNTNVSSPPR